MHSILRKFSGCLTVVLLLAGLFVSTASAAQPPVGLGTATAFAVLAGQTVTNTGPSNITGDVGVHPGTTITGFPPGRINGTIHAADAVAARAQADLITAYNDAAGRTPATAVPSDIGGRILAPGVYRASSEMHLTGTVILDGQNDPDSVFILQVGSALITASNSTVRLIRGAHVCNVYWQVGSSATLGTDTTFVGTVMALTSASVQTRAMVEGRVLVRNGQVSLDNNRITRPECQPPTSTTTTSTTTTSTTTTSATTTSTTTTSGGDNGTGDNGNSSGGDNDTGDTGNGSGGDNDTGDTGNGSGGDNDTGDNGNSSGGDGHDTGNGSGGDNDTGDNGNGSGGDNDTGNQTPGTTRPTVPGTPPDEPSNGDADLPETT